MLSFLKRKLAAVFIFLKTHDTLFTLEIFYKPPSEKKKSILHTQGPKCLSSEVDRKHENKKEAMTKDR